MACEVKGLEHTELIELIIKEVMKRIGKTGKKALALFTGGTIGFEEACRQIEKLRGDSWDIRLLFTDAAEKIHQKERIRKQFIGFDVCFESEFVTEQDFLENIDLMLIPVMTINTAAKTALGISDTPAAHLVSSALINGIPIIAAKDACNPENHLKSGLKANKQAEVYIKKIKNHIETMESYGIKLVSVCGLHEAAVLSADSESKIKGGIRKKIITKEDIIQAKQDGSMKVIIGKNSSITSYAKDAADELGVEIVCI